jgi:hypothetical protein
MKRINKIAKFSLVYVLLIYSFIANGQVQPKPQWWLEEPFRMVQTNLREIDAKDFDIDLYVNSLKDIGANTVLINVGGIVANYYTGLDFQYRNPYLKIDMIQEVVGRLQNEGIRVIGRFDFSKLNGELAAQKPEWLYKSAKGETVNYNGQVHTCVNGGYQQEYSLAILKEALTRFPLDGVFFNMIGYQTRDYSNTYHGICQSEACRKRFHEWSDGLNLPLVEDNNDPVFRKYRQFKSETSNELFYRIHDLIKSFGNHIAINTYTHAGTDFYRKEANSHGAFYSNFVPWEFEASHNVKSIVGSWKDKQASNAAVHFYGYPARHSADARWLTQQRLFQNIISGAGVDFYCIGRLDNLEDRLVLQNVKDVFQFHKKNEKHLHHTVSGNKVLLLHDNQSHSEYQGIFEILTENHVLFDVMEHWCINTADVPREMESYEVVVMPDITSLSDVQCQKLDNYVDNGGKLLVTGFTSTKDEIGNPLNKIRVNSLGAEPEYKTFNKEQGTFFRVFEKDKKRLGNPVLEHFDLVYAWEQGLLCQTKPGAEGMLGFIPPAMIGPPEKTYYTEVTEIPGLIFNSTGKGKTSFISFRIGSLYHHTRHYGHSALVMGALNNLLEYENEMVTNASPLVEIARQKSSKGQFEWYGLLNHSGHLGNGFHEPLPIQHIELKIQPEKRIRSVKKMTDGNELPWQTKENGWVEVVVPELQSFEIILVEY